MKNQKLIISIAVLVFMTTSAIAQKCYSSGSISMNRTNGISSSDQIVVELPPHQLHPRSSLDF